MRFSPIGPLIDLLSDYQIPFVSELKFFCCWKSASITPTLVTRFSVNRQCRSYRRPVKNLSPVSCKTPAMKQWNKGSPSQRKNFSRKLNKKSRHQELRWSRIMKKISSKKSIDTVSFFKRVTGLTHSVRILFRNRPVPVRIKHTQLHSHPELAFTHSK